MCFFFSSRRRHTRYIGDWSSDVCSSDLGPMFGAGPVEPGQIVLTGKSEVPFEVAVDGGACSNMAWPNLEPSPVSENRSEERRVGKEWRAERRRRQEESTTKVSVRERMAK